VSLRRRLCFFQFLRNCIINQSIKNKVIQKEYQAKQKTMIEKIINQPHSIQRKKKNSIGDELQHRNKSNQIDKKNNINTDLSSN
jgi:hypothetical protein